MVDLSWRQLAKPSSALPFACQQLFLPLSTSDHIDHISLEETQCLDQHVAFKWLQKVIAMHTNMKKKRVLINEIEVDICMLIYSSAKNKHVSLWLEHLHPQWTTFIANLNLKYAD